MIQLFFTVSGLPQNSGGGDNFAFWEKKEITFESAVNSMVSSLQLLWRYGMSLFRMESHTSSFLTDFGRYVDGGENR